MTWLKNLMYAAIGAGALFLAQLGYNAVTGPDLVYRHVHLVNPAQYRSSENTIEGAKFYKFLGEGGVDRFKMWEEPTDFRHMVQSAVSRFNHHELLEQAGIDPEDGISELEIRVKR